jgi:hypothetical protein
VSFTCFLHAVLEPESVGAPETSLHRLFCIHINQRVYAPAIRARALGLRQFSFDHAISLKLPSSHLADFISSRLCQHAMFPYDVSISGKLVFHASPLYLLQHYALQAKTLRTHFGIALLILRFERVQIEERVFFLLLFKDA